MLIYQVYPRSFQDSNNDGIGDLKGLLAKLPYLKKLGIDSIWISPFFKSPMKDFGYDISDYRSVDPIFGSNQDFYDILAEAKKLDLGIMIDMVLSHTSDKHQWFIESRDKNSPKRDWYLWADAAPDGSPPNNWLSVFGGSAWEWDPLSSQYYFHSFLNSQPDINMHNPDVQNAIFEEMEYWLKLGVTGFRFDACNHYFQDLQLRNNPPKFENRSVRPYSFQYHRYDQGQPEMLPFLEKLRNLLDKYGAFSLAEVGGDNSLELMGHYTQPNRLHSAYSFAFMGENSSPQYISHIVRELENTIKAPHNACFALSNHDKPRVASRWLQGRNMKEHSKAMMALLLSLKGNICIYQGEELGLPEADVPFEYLQDPYGKTYWPKFKGRDGCRTPMPWTTEKHGGFTEGNPWLPMPEEHIELCVEHQENDPNSVLNFSRKMIQLRKDIEELSKGNIEFLIHENNILLFSRELNGSKVYCLFNMGHNVEKVSVYHDVQILEQQKCQIRDRQVVLEVSGFCIYK